MPFYSTLWIYVFYCNSTCILTSNRRCCTATRFTHLFHIKRIVEIWFNMMCLIQIGKQKKNRLEIDIVVKCLYSKHNILGLIENMFWTYFSDIHNDWVMYTYTFWDYNFVSCDSYILLLLL